MAKRADYKPWFVYDGYAYEMKMDVVSAADSTKVMHPNLIQYVPGCETPEAACRLLRGVFRRGTSKASKRQPSFCQGVRCSAPAVLHVRTIREITHKEYDDYVRDHSASIDLSGKGAPRPSFDELRRARRVKQFKVIERSRDRE